MAGQNFVFLLSSIGNSLITNICEKAERGSHTNYYRGSHTNYYLIKFKKFRKERV